MKTTNKPLAKKCQYCGKEIISLYPNQLDYNIKAHEISCPDNPINKKLKEEAAA